MSNRPTPAQDYLESFVASNPGVRPMRAAEAIGPNGSRKYGYATIDRAIQAGRVVWQPDAKRSDWGRLYLPEDVPAEEA